MQRSSFMCPGKQTECATYFICMAWISCKSKMPKLNCMIFGHGSVPNWKFHFIVQNVFFF